MIGIKIPYIYIKVLKRLIEKEGFSSDIKQLRRVLSLPLGITKYDSDMIIQDMEELGLISRKMKRKRVMYLYKREAETFEKLEDGKIENIGKKFITV